MLDAALGYAARSWPLIPLVPGDKPPLGRLVPHGLKDATTDADCIREWWTAEPTANIGLVTGINFDVLDIDGDVGWTTLANAVNKFGCLSSSPVSMTGGGGGHDLFLPTGGKNRVRFLPNLDWRGVGGYIVAPPSFHPNGTQYEWALSPDEVPIEAAPTWLIELVTSRNERPDDVTQVPSFRLSPYARRALEAECGRVALAAKGRRNDQLNASAYALGQLVGSRALGAEEAGQALLLAAARAGLSEDEATATIRSGLSAGIRSPRPVTS